MVYMLMMMVIAAIAAFSIMSSYRTRQLALFTAIVVAYAAALCFFFLYLCKDALHLSIFLNYLPFPRSIVLQLYTLRISKMAILRLLNLSCLLFLFCNLLFACSFLRDWPRFPTRLVAWVGGVCFLLQLLIYDPGFYIWLYRWLYPAHVSSVAIQGWYAVSDTLTTLLNGAVLAGCVLAVAVCVSRLPHQRRGRFNLVAVCVSYTLLLISYVMLFSNLPRLLVKYSKVADSVTTLSLASASRMRYYQYFPYVVLFLLLLLGVSFLAFSVASQRAERQNLEVVRGIKAANVSSRLFCHYMKNEILAISAEIEELVGEGPRSEEATAVLERCDAIYAKLDGIHKSMREDAMSIKRIPLEPVLAKTVENVQAMRRLEEVEVRLKVGAPAPWVMADPVFLEQALMEVLMNAGDAMAQSEEKLLTIEVQSGIRWVTVDIRDTGCGIDSEHLADIFTPLYTSKAISRNWGIGLTMAHKIINGLGGRINVRSTLGEGTTFELMLPAVRAEKQMARQAAGRGAGA